LIQIALNRITETLCPVFEKFELIHVLVSRIMHDSIQTILIRIVVSLWDFDFYLIDSIHMFSKSYQSSWWETWIDSIQV